MDKRQKAIKKCIELDQLIGSSDSKHTKPLIDKKLDIMARNNISYKDLVKHSVIIKTYGERL